MNKELILQYKTEFDHWLNGGEVLFFTWKWYNSKDNPKVTFNHSEPEKIKHYIINDEYVEFRKAIAEGKIVQEQDYFNKQWLDMKTDDFHGASDTQYEGVYRIKPEEPKFKVGDWVFLEFINLDKNSKYRVCKAKIEGIRDNSYYNDKECTSLISELPNNEGDWIITGLWQPEPSEWCWNSIFGLVKVICEATENENPCYLCWNPWKKLEQKLTNLEPFIGELPSHLKD